MMHMKYSSSLSSSYKPSSVSQAVLSVARIRVPSYRPGFRTSDTDVGANDYGLMGFEAVKAKRKTARITPAHVLGFLFSAGGLAGDGAAIERLGGWAMAFYPAHGIMEKPPGA